MGAIGQRSLLRIGGACLPAGGILLVYGWEDAIRVLFAVFVLILGVGCVITSFFIRKL